MKALEDLGADQLSPELAIVLAITGLVRELRREREDQLAEVLREPIALFVADAKRSADRQDREDQKSALQPDRPNLYRLREYLQICEKLQLDPRAPETKAILRNLTP